MDFEKICLLLFAFLHFCYHHETIPGVNLLEDVTHGQNWVTPVLPAGSAKISRAVYPIQAEHIYTCSKHFLLSVTKLMWLSIIYQNLLIKTAFKFPLKSSSSFSLWQSRKNKIAYQRPRPTQLIGKAMMSFLLLLPPINRAALLVNSSGHLPFVIYLIFFSTGSCMISYHYIF